MKKFSVKNAIISAFFGALGPYFNKQAKFDNSGAIYHWLNDQGYPWAVYIFDVLMIIMMLWSNTISVKYKMLSYKQDGAFIGTTMIFILGYIFSSGFDYLYDQQILPLERILGALLIILGILMISWQEEQDKVKKLTNSVLVLVSDREDNPTDPNSPAKLKQRLEESAQQNYQDEDEKEGALIDRSLRSGVVSLISQEKSSLSEPLVDTQPPATPNDCQLLLRQTEESRLQI
jgi:hypothetical protein